MRILGAILLFFSAAAYASPSVSSIVLKDAIVTRAGAPILLRDVAALSGDDAAPLGDVVLADDAASVARGGDGAVTMDAVKAALRGRRVNWGRVVLRGTECRVRLTQPELPAPTTTAQPTTPQPIETGPTIGDRVVALLANLHGVPPADLRLAPEAGDKSLLAQPIAGRRIELVPEASAASPRVPVRVRVYEGEAIVIDRSVLFDLEIRRAAVVASAPIRRGETLDAGSLTIEQVWLDPRVKCLAEVSEAAGRTSIARLSPGEPVTFESLKGEIVVKRNELITVRCLSGGLVLAGRARALEEGAAGDTVELRLEGGQKTFRGVMVSRGVAVVNLDSPAGSADAGAEADRP